MDGDIDKVRSIQDIELDLLSGKVTVELLDEYSGAIERGHKEKIAELFKNRAHTIAYEMAGASGGNMMSITPMQEALMVHISAILAVEATDGQ